MKSDLRPHPSNLTHTYTRIYKPSQLPSPHRNIHTLPHIHIHRTSRLAEESTPFHSLSCWSAEAYYFCSLCISVLPA
ncbi:hypothetical protein PDJAM_G00085290 [Pangasius djambal]|uniref:Uncharacterized protein n=1 Tax=Pangasius djambal TaxID=1691987 RepID=A0ACC5Z513_9TELE|nr:hypothetical protein [Pangasius djambal]